MLAAFLDFAILGHLSLASLIMCSIHRLIFFFAAVLPIIAYGQSSSISVQINGTPPATSQTVASILERRFEGVMPGFLNFVSARTDGSQVTVHFFGWRPSNAQSDYLLRTTGRFKCYFPGERDTPFIVDSDIADSRPLAGREKSDLAIRLNDAAAIRVEATTRSGTGKMVVVEWEGRIVTRLRLAGPISRDISLTLPAEYDVLLMSSALRGGRIPDGTTLTLAK